MTIRWSRVIIGVLLGLFSAFLILSALALIIMAVGSAATITAVMALPRYDFASSVLVALGACWGAYLALRRSTAATPPHGALIGIGVGLVNFLFNPASFISNILTLLMAVPAGVLGARLAYHAQQRRANASPSPDDVPSAP